GKLALLRSKEGRRPSLVAADLQRPAAIDQLAQLGEQVGVPVYADERSDPVKAVHDGIERAKADGRYVVILDTAGRLHVDEELMEELAAVRRMMKGEFTFDDFLSSYKMLRRMGPLQGVLKMIPGLGKQLEGLDQVDEHQLKRVEAIILSMTPHERRVPHAIDASRRKRIAGGSGTIVEQVNQLSDARKQMAKLMKATGSGKMTQI